MQRGEHPESILLRTEHPAAEQSLSPSTMVGLDALEQWVQTGAVCGKPSLYLKLTRSVLGAAVSGGLHLEERNPVRDGVNT